MKTAQIMIRDLKGLPVRQNHKTGMFNANDLLDIYNKRNPDSLKRLDSFLKTQSTQEYMDFLAKKLSQPEDSQNVALQLDFSNTAKKRELIRPENVIKTSRGSKNGGTWMYHNLFIDFAMWLNVEFKDWVIDCVSDKLILFRDQAGDSFKEVNTALTTKLGQQRHMEYIKEANMINELVFGNGQGGQRNQATEQELDMLNRLQRADVKLIKEGHSFDSRRKNLGIYKSLSE